MVTPPKPPLSMTLSRWGQSQPWSLDPPASMEARRMVLGSEGTLLVFFTVER
jgi:hypothetical protein